MNFEGNRCKYSDRGQFKGKYNCASHKRDRKKQNEKNGTLNTIPPEYNLVVYH
jgi:hypothetical protein